MPSPFTYVSGTGGFAPAAFNLLTTELNGLASGNTAISTVGGTSGVFSQTQTSGAIWAEVSFVSGGAFTPSTPNFLGGWFLRKGDNTNFEKYVANTSLPRGFDFVIPLFASAYAANDLSMANALVRLPPESFEVLLWSQAGVALPATGNKLVCGGFEIQV